MENDTAHLEPAKEKSNEPLTSHALLGMGLYVVETRSRRRDKTLTDWKPLAGFIQHDMAGAFHEQYAKIGYARILLPNSGGMARELAAQDSDAPNDING